MFPLQDISGGFEPSRDHRPLLVGLFAVGRDHLLDLLRGVPHRELFDLVLDGGLILRGKPLADGRKPFPQIGAVHDLAQGGPVRVRESGDEGEPVPALHVRIRENGIVVIPGPGHLLPRHVEILHDVIGDRHQPFRRRCVDELPLPRLPPVKHRRLDPERRPGAAGVPPHPVPLLQRLLVRLRHGRVEVRLAGNRHNDAPCLVDDVVVRLVGALFRIAAELTVRVDGGEDQPGVAFTKETVPQPECLQVPRLEGVDQHVGFLRKAQKKLLPLLRGDIEGDVVFVPSFHDVAQPRVPDHDPVGGHLSGEVSPGRFDPDHLRSHFGQQRRGEEPGEAPVAQIQDEHIVEGFRFSGDLLGVRFTMRPLRVFPIGRQADDIRIVHFSTLHASSPESSCRVREF